MTRPILPAGQWETLQAVAVKQTAPPKVLAGETNVNLATLYGRLNNLRLRGLIRKHFTGFALTELGWEMLAKTRREISQPTANAA